MSARDPPNLRRWVEWGVKAGKLGDRRKFWVGAENCKWRHYYEIRMTRGREFQIVGTATSKLREPKHVRTRGTNNSLESDESKALCQDLGRKSVFSVTVSLAHISTDWANPTKLFLGYAVWFPCSTQCVTTVIRRMHFRGLGPTMTATAMETW